MAQRRSQGACDCLPIQRSARCTFKISETRFQFRSKAVESQFHIERRVLAVEKILPDYIYRLLEKVCSVHGKNHPELLHIRTSFAGLAQELTMHMMKEEMVLFPYIVRMEEAVIQNEPILPPPFGSVQNPVSMMEHEHDSAGCCLAGHATGQWWLRRSSRCMHQLPDALQSSGGIRSGSAPTHSS